MILMLLSAVVVFVLMTTVTSMKSKLDDDVEAFLRPYERREEDALVRVLAIQATATRTRPCNNCGAPDQKGPCHYCKKEPAHGEG